MVRSNELVSILAPVVRRRYIEERDRRRGLLMALLCLVCTTACGTPSPSSQAPRPQTQPAAIATPSSRPLESKPAPVPKVTGAPKPAQTASATRSTQRASKKGCFMRVGWTFLEPERRTECGSCRRQCDARSFRRRQVEVCDRCRNDGDCGPNQECKMRNAAPAPSVSLGRACQGSVKRRECVPKPKPVYAVCRPAAWSAGRLLSKEADSRASKSLDRHQGSPRFHRPASMPRLENAPNRQRQPVRVRRDRTSYYDLVKPPPLDLNQKAGEVLQSQSLLPNGAPPFKWFAKALNRSGLVAYIARDGNLYMSDTTDKEKGSTQRLSVEAGPDETVSPFYTVLSGDRGLVYLMQRNWGGIEVYHVDYKSGTNTLLTSLCGAQTTLPLEIPRSNKVLLHASVGGVQLIATIDLASGKTTQLTLPQRGWSNGYVSGDGAYFYFGILTTSKQPRLHDVYRVKLR